jgi:hypothetical protein
LSDDRDSDKFQAVDQTAADRPAQTRGNGCKAEKQQDRRQSEPESGRESLEPAGAQKTNRESHLAARRAWQELTESNKVGKGFVIKPAATLDKFPPKVSQMCNGTTEARQPHFEKNREYLQCRTRPSRVR